MSVIGVVALLAVLTAAGCAGSSTAPGGSAASGHTSRTVRVGFADSGRTVRVHPGDVVEVRLHSTYWSFQPVAASALHAGKPVVHAVPIGTGVAGSGAGTVTVDFRAADRGRATITAARRSCGEALRCTGSQGRFTLDVVVG